MKHMNETAEYAKQLVRGEKAGPGIMNKLNLWLGRMMIDKDANTFIRAEDALKRLEASGFDKDQIYMIRDAATKAAYAAVNKIQAKYPEFVPDKYVSNRSDNFEVFKLFLNCGDEIRAEMAALTRKLFDAKLDKISDKLIIKKKGAVREDYGDEDGDEDGVDTFYVVFNHDGDEDSGAVWIGMLSKQDGKWQEESYSGKPDSRWGGNYMSYLTPEQVMDWLNKDYGRHMDIEGPFLDAHEAEEYAAQLGGVTEQARIKYDTSAGSILKIVAETFAKSHRAPSTAVNLAEADAASMWAKRVAKENRDKVKAMRDQAKADMLARVKSKAPATKAAPSLDTIWRQVEMTVANVYPDGDPVDAMLPWFKKQGILAVNAGDYINKAAKKNGYKDIYDYFNQMDDLSR